MAFLNWVILEIQCLGCRLVMLSEALKLVDFYEHVSSETVKGEAQSYSGTCKNWKFENSA